MDSHYFIPDDVITIDVETTGLWVSQGHQPWEVSYAVGEQQPRTLLLRHDPSNADPTALRINNYHDRWDPHGVADLRQLNEFNDMLTGRYTLGANVGFDREMLSFWNVVPPVWHYRPLELTSMVMLALGLECPVSLHNAVTRVNDAWGLEIPLPDHSSYTDVVATREVYRAVMQWRLERKES